MGLREIYLTLVYLSFFVIGSTAPFVLSLGYVWVDIFYPQAISNTLASFPIAMIIGLAAIFGYLVGDRKNPAVSAHTVLTVLMAIWVSATMLWAEAPEIAAVKYSWAFKTVLFSAFLPFVFRSRVQIEAFLLVFVFSCALYMLPVGVKTFISGSSYGRSIGIVTSNSGLNESSTLATVSIAIIPLFLFMRQHSLLLPKSKLRDLGLLGMSFLSVFGAIGTFARTAVVSFGILAGDMFLRSRRKILFIAVGVVVTLVAGYNMSAGWDNRMSTIESYDQESSAYTRILVWKWTLGYVSTHPFGGGFNDYVISRIEYPPMPGEMQGQIVVGRAFHSSYFEVLGEHGFPGLAIFLSLAGLSLFSLQKVRRQTKRMPHLLWAYDLAGALRTALLVVMAGSAFVGIAFQPPFWYFFAIIAALRHHVKIVLDAELDLNKRARKNVFTNMAQVRPLMPAARLAS